MASRVVTRFYDEILRSVGLRATQLAVLVAVGNEDVMSITALAKFMGMDRSTLTRNLAPLEREGLIRVGNEGCGAAAQSKSPRKDARDCVRPCRFGRRLKRRCDKSLAAGNGPSSWPT